MRHNLKIGDWLFILMGIGHCVGVTQKFWSDVHDTPMRNPIFGWGELSSLPHYPIFGMLDLNSLEFQQNTTLLMAWGMLYAYLFGLMIIVVGLLCMYVERTLNQTIPHFISLILFFIFDVTIYLLSHIDPFPWSQLDGSWLGVYISLYLILCRYLSRRARGQ